MPIKSEKQCNFQLDKDQNYFDQKKKERNGSEVNWSEDCIELQWRLHKF